LHILAALRAAIGFTLYAATLDHGLRGAASAADAQFVVETARVWGIPARRGNADVPALAARQSGGIEAAARAARYDFLASVAREVGADRIAVAHHADDQVETVLLHLLRGAGIGGLRGMAWIAPTPGSPDLLLIRPLLGVTRAEIDTYCREYGIQPR